MIHLVWLLLAIAPLAALARFARVYPHRLLTGLLLAAAALAIPLVIRQGPWFDIFLPIVIAFDVLVAGLAIVDLLLLRGGTFGRTRNGGVASLADAPGDVAADQPFEADLVVGVKDDVDPRMSGGRPISSYRSARGAARPGIRTALRRQARFVFRWCSSRLSRLHLWQRY